ncbi:MAG TPA: PilZ domain-containing protein [Candidatus Omnitrophota bacterium]|nr:PilZ domain-containing protein [Candidatus Omnitrophota bacterium]
MTTERRRSKRVNAPFFVKICCSGAGNQKKWEQTSAKNVNEHGLALTTAHGYDIDLSLALLMRIPTQPTQDWLETDGKVVDCSKIMDNAFITRIEFVDPSPSVKEALKKYVDWISKR